MTKHELEITLKKIQNLALVAANTDGGHHKQWYLEQILKETGMPVDEARENGLSWQEGIAP